MKKFIITEFLFITTLFLFACRQYYITREISYKIDCRSCGRSSDGYISIDVNTLNKQIDPHNPLAIVLTNHSNEIILLNLKLFTISADNYVVLNPIGMRSPNTSYSRSSTSSVMSFGSEKATYLYNLNPFLKSFEYAVGASHYSSYSETNYPNDTGVLPANSIIIYPIVDYIEDLYSEKVGRYKSFWKRYYSETYWDNINKYLDYLEERLITITIVYKLLNESNWRSASVEYKCNDFIYYDFEEKF